MRDEEGLVRIGTGRMELGRGLTVALTEETEYPRSARVLSNPRRYSYQAREVPLQIAMR